MHIRERFSSTRAKAAALLCLFVVIGTAAYFLSKRGQGPQGVAPLSRYLVQIDDLQSLEPERSRAIEAPSQAPDIESAEGPVRGESDGITITGTVINESYEPITGVTLRVTVQPGNVEKVVVTDDVGGFSQQCTDLLAGTLVTIVIRGDDPIWSVIPESRRVQYEGPIHVREILVATSRACLVRGSLLYHDGMPVSSGVISDWAGQATLSKQDGSFELMTSVWNSSITLKYAEGRDAEWATKLTRFALAEHQISSGLIEDVKLLVDRCSSQIKLQIEDESGVPVEGAVVTRAGQSVGTPSDQDGLCVIRYSDAADSMLWVTKLGFSRVQLSTRDFLGREYAEVTLHELEPQIGSVFDSVGQPVAGATIEVSTTSEGGGDLLRTVSDRNGQFMFFEAPDASIVFLEARSKDGRRGSGAFLSAGSRHPPRLILQDQGVLSGIVVDADGRPVQGVVVYGIREDRGEVGHPYDATNLAGQFTLRAEADAVYRVSAVARGYRRQSVLAQASNELRIVLSRAGILSGRVIGPDGYPVQQCEVRAMVTRDDGGLHPVTPWLAFHDEGYFLLSSSTLGSIGSIHVVQSRQQGFREAAAEVLVEAVPTYSARIIHRIH